MSKNKTAAERLNHLAEMLTLKAEEIRERTQGVEAYVNTTKNKTTSK